MVGHVDYRIVRRHHRRVRNQLHVLGTAPSTATLTPAPQSASIEAGLPGVTSYIWLDSKDVEIYFSEPLTSATATLLTNYSITGGITLSAAALAHDGTLVTLTTNQALSSGNSYTITMNNLATVSGDPLPASLPLLATYQSPIGTILDQVWDNLDGARHGR